MWQRSRTRKLLEGDRNTAYFHVVANQRRRKNHLAVLVGGDGPVTTNTDMLQVATEFYKSLLVLSKKTTSIWTLLLV